ncbi:MAG: SLC13 family permease [Deltaproteobacteria bacterium]|nr:SLC13 family permease [Deltaproteobacteria bacterium]MBW1896396.1 SLC13 family permease [Deltaproteobacteria bacterium]
MFADQYITIAILALTFALLIKSKIPPVAVFVGALTLTITFGLAPLGDSLKGFSNSGMLTVGALLMVAAGMYRTGAITVIADKLIGRPKSLLAAQARILPPVAVGSAFLNNTPLVAMFIPVIRDLAKISRLPAPRLYIPLSFASILGGTCTLIGTSTNLVVAGMVIDFLAKGDPNAPPLREIAMFDLAWIGLPATVVGIAFIMLLSRFLLPGTKETESAAETTRLFGTEFKVAADAPIIGKTLENMGYINALGFELLALKRYGMDEEVEIKPQSKLVAGDVLVYSATLEAIPDLWGTKGLEPIYGTEVRDMVSARHSHRLVEAVVSRRATALGRQIKELPLPEGRLQGSIIAISRGGRRIEGPMSDVRVEAGDVGVLEVGESFFYENQRTLQFSMVRRLTGATIKRYDRAAYATLITVAMVAVVAMGHMTMLNAALLASGVMILTGCMNFRQAGNSLEFSTLIIIASAIGLEAAVTGSGLSTKIAELLGLVGGNNPYMALTVVFIGCIIMDTMITNVASAVFMFPISMAMAGSLGVNGMPFVITVMVGASCSFISPMGYQTNLMVYGPGGYKFTDFVKIGIPMTVVVGIITIIIAPVVWPF